MTGSKHAHYQGGEPNPQAFSAEGNPVEAVAEGSRESTQ